MKEKMKTFRLEVDEKMEMEVCNLLMTDENLSFHYYTDSIGGYTRSYFIVTVENESQLPKKLIGWQPMICL